jgi:amino acid adenylation domain-containing protein
MNQPPDRTSRHSLAEKRTLLARLIEEKAAKVANGKAGSPQRAAVAHRLIERQVARTPDAVAVACGGSTLTYRELDIRSNRLAHHLRALSVGPEVLVGLCVGRSPGMLVALLAVLKAGGAYVPLDPAFPESRLAFMLDDARVAVLVTEQAIRESLPAGDARVVCMDSDREGLDALPDTAPTVEVGPENLAYVIYTSGSTGRPKGVQITHGALDNFLRSLKASLAIGERDALLAVTTLSFDIAALELFVPLLAGARIELATREEAVDASRLIERLSGAGVTFLQATPATWRLLLDGGWTGSPGLTMLCGGESLPRALADRLLDKGTALWNLYGPTETTIWSSLAKVEPGEGPVPIGQPIAATQLYVLDARFRPVPVGVTGELYVGGAGVARGYLNRPGLTAERFLPDPFGQGAGGRLYRTGDLARWRPDGVLECLGREDHQVKVRGFRVELGEIEAALAAFPALREAAVVARDDPSGEKALAAYVAPRPGLPVPQASELRRWLAGSLPEYMVPSTFVTLDSLPLTPNGKVDRNALPDPGKAPASTGEAYVPPRGPVEGSLVSLWVELLGRDRVGVHDNFFELGGHSIIATQLLARLRDVFAVEPSLRDFLDAPTVAGLSRLIERELAAGAGLQAPPIERADRDGPLPASFPQQRLWFLDQLEPGSASYNIPTAVRLAGELNVPALSAAFDEVVRRHEILRTTFKAEVGVPLQVVGRAVPLPPPIDDLSGLSETHREAEARRLMGEEARAPFDLSRGPMLRARLLRLGDVEHILCVTMHHIASDGWSIGVLIREVAALYESFRLGQSSTLDEPALQYGDFAVWQRGWLQGDVLQSQLDYWSSRLAGVPTLELPTDRPRPPVPSHRGAQRSTLLPTALVSEIQALGRKEGVTLFMTLLSAFQTLLYRYSGLTDIAVGSPIAGRPRSELEDLIGFFVNTLVLRGDLSGDPSFRTLLRRVRQDALGAYAHQDLPFEQLVGILHPDRDASRSPLFQVMFALQNAPMALPTSSELELTLLDTTSGTSKFDLTLNVSDSEDGLLASMEYSSDLFEASTIDRMLGHFKTLLEAAVANADQPVSDLTMLTETERQALIGSGGPSVPADLDGLSAEELNDLLQQLESDDHAQFG